MQAIEELPGQESPEIFGLHPNADLTFRTLQVQSGVQIIMDTQPKGAGGGGGLSREEIVDRICEDLLSKVIQQAGKRFCCHVECCCPGHSFVFQQEIHYFCAPVCFVKRVRIS